MEKASLRSAENVLEIELGLSNQQRSASWIGKVYDRISGGPDSRLFVDMMFNELVRETS